MERTDLTGGATLPRLPILEELSFILDEPADDSSRPDEKTADEIKSAAHAGLRVLIAEDDEDDYEFLRELLLEQRPGLQVTRFTNGADLTDYLVHTEAPAPNLLILDLNMPFKDGREALREIKALGRFHSLPVFILTTSGSPADEAFAYDFPSVSFATKPARYQEYVALAKNLIQRLLPGGTPENR